MKDKEKQLGLDEGTFDAALSAANRPTYSGTFDDQLKGIYDRIANREKFNYDVNADPLYQAAKDQKIQGGKLAMRDTMGKAAALTGGYGSSYGQQVGQQAYDAYLQSLSDSIPELYGLAYQRHRDEGNDLLTQAGLLQSQRDAEYGRWRDELGDWENERAWQQQREEQAYNRQWAEDERAYARDRDRVSDERYADQLAYSRDRDRVADERYADELAYARDRDRVSDERYADQLAYSRDRDRVSDERYADELNYNRQMTEQSNSFSRQQQAYANLYALIRASGYMPTDQELTEAGMTREAAQALQNEFNRSITPVVTGGSSGGGSSSGGSSGGGRSSGGSSGGSGQSGAPGWWNAMTDAQRRSYQASIGTAADGIWGPNTRAASQAADGLTGTYGGGGGSNAAVGATSGAGGGNGLTFSSQREFDTWLRNQVSAGTITMREATDLRDQWSSRVVQ